MAVILKRSDFRQVKARSCRSIIVKEIKFKLENAHADKYPACVVRIL